MVKKYIVKNMNTNEETWIKHAWNWKLNDLYGIDLLDGNGIIFFKVLKIEEIKPMKN